MVTYYMQTYMGVFMCLDSVIMSALSLVLWKMVTALPSKGIPSHYALDPTNFRSLFQYYMDLPWLLLHVYYTVLPYLLLGLYHWYQKSPFQEICQFTSISHSSCPSKSMLLTGNEYDVWNDVIIRSWNKTVLVVELQLLGLLKEINIIIQHLLCSGETDFIDILHSHSLSGFTFMAPFLFTWFYSMPTLTTLLPMAYMTKLLLVSYIH